MYHGAPRGDLCLPSQLYFPSNLLEVRASQTHPPVWGKSALPLLCDLLTDRGKLNFIQSILVFYLFQIFILKFRQNFRAEGDREAMFITHSLCVRLSSNGFMHAHCYVKLYNSPRRCYHFHLKLKTLIFEKKEVSCLSSCSQDVTKLALEARVLNFKFIVPFATLYFSVMVWANFILLSLHLPF